MSKWINVDDIIAEQKKYCFLCEGEEETTHCSVCFAKDVVSAIIYHTQGIDIVRCGECKWADNCSQNVAMRESYQMYEKLNFCSYGERKESE